MEKPSIYEELSSDILKTDKFTKAYEEVLKSQHIATKHESKLSLDDIKFLLQCAGIFSLSKEECKKLAYKIATILSENYSKEYNELDKVVQYIIINSGQLPVVKKNIQEGSKDYFSTYKESDIPFNPFLFKTVLLKQAINKLPFPFEGEDVYLTDFQSKALHDLEEGKSISLSAPTSAGKSFLLKAYLAEKFRIVTNYNVVYLVPTRALISQVQRDFRVGLKEFGVADVFISSSANYSPEKIQPKKLFVFTQERFHNLLFDAEFDEPLDVLIVDEAQKVSDGGRGILLEEVIEETIKRNETKNAPLQKIFLSPFTKNPQKFAEMFHLKDLETDKTKLSPVSQNLLKLNVDKNGFVLSLSTEELDHEIELHKENIEATEIEGFVSMKKDWPLLWASKKFAADFNIVYCNSPAKAVKFACLFAEMFPEVNDAEITEVISFLKDQVNPNYYLIDCLKKGVAYHYGKMPTQIRNFIEELFKNKKIKFIFCTSTLLEGVNLPAQNIFIFKPSMGSIKLGMNRLSFWNLAGRAGRLLKDYYGNIFCINVADWNGYKPDPKDVEHEIESILESMFIHKDKEIMEYLKGLYLDLKREDEPIEQAIAKFIIQQMKEGQTEFVNNLIKRNPNFKDMQDKLTAIHEEIKRIASTIQLPYGIIQKNSSINPILQQGLLQKFRASQPVVPAFPTDTGSLNNLRQIYQLINEFFRGKNDSSHAYFAPLTYSWINNKSIAELINFKIYRLKKSGEPTKEMLNLEIDKLFSDINETVRFEYQKYLKCYTDILLYYYEESGYDTKKICTSLPMYLEYGSFTKNVIALQSIGLSRATAIAINSSLHADFADENDCIAWLKKNKDVVKKRIPSLLWSEVRDIT